jgi:hypothetical protein
MTSKYDAIMTAMDSAVTELEKLPADERPGWLAYFLEALEEAEGVEALERVRDLLQQRIEEGRW